MNINQRIHAFLTTQAYFLYAYSYFSPCLTKDTTYGFIPKSKRKDFLTLLAELARDTKWIFTKLKRKDGSAEFFITPFGVYFISDRVVEEEMFFISPTANDFTNTSFEIIYTANFKIIYPEIVLSWIKEQSPEFFINKKIYKNIKDSNKNTIATISNLIKINKQKSLETKEEYVRKSKEFILFFTSLTGESAKTKALANRLWNFPLFFRDSVDSAEYKRGKLAEDNLIKEIQEFGINHSDVFSMLYKLKTVK